MMLLRPPFTRTTTSASIFSAVTAVTHHLFSTTTKPPRLNKILSKIPSKHRLESIQQAQKVITDYLHSTRTLPFIHAQNISKNASFSISEYISKIPFQHSTFLNSLHRFLRYHPINEFQFFYESIGMDYVKIDSSLPLNKFFLSEDSRVFSAACALADFGFPWNKLGVLYRQKVEIFDSEDTYLCKKLSGFTDSYGFHNSVIIGICLAFPDVLSGFGQSDELFSDLKRVLLYTDLVNHVKGNVDATYEVCRKIRLFYELGCSKGEIGDFLVTNHNIFIDYSEDHLARNIEFFCKLGVDKEQVGLLLMSKPEILSFHLDDRVITVSTLLKHFNLSLENLSQIERDYPYILGKNRMVNVPHIIRAMDLSGWFFNIIKHGDHSLLATYASSNQGEDTDDDFRNNLQKILSRAKYVNATRKLDFLLEIGFGENELTMKAMSNLGGSSSELFERFNFLLSLGIKFSKLCKMISSSPTILNRNRDLLEKKIKFLCEEMGSSVDYLNKFPGYLTYDLENRIKPRHKFYMWLKAQGWYRKESYSVASMIVTTEKKLVARISNIHPDAPKKWVEFQKERRKPVA